VQPPFGFAAGFRPFANRLVVGEWLATGPLTRPPL
jgi:hypothetical protein